MESRPDLKLLRILENFRHHFAFLFRRGFHIVSVIFIDQNYENWQIMMMTDNCIIKIYSYMGKVELALSIPQLYDVVGLFEVNDLIYGVDGTVDFSDPAEEPPMNEVQSLRRIAQLLDKHIDDILEKIGKMLNLLSIDDPPIPLSKPGQTFPYN
jgi:hypothetical protein